MRYAVSVPPFADFFQPRVLAELAREAEHAGWDGFFVWDHVLLWPTPICDTWVALAAIALATEHIRIGPVVTPLPRRRPVKLAREAVSIDHLSGGRLILGIGSGAGPWEYDYLGEQPSPKVRGEMLDEALDLLARLWTGEPLIFDGRFYTFRGDLGPGRPDRAPTPLLPRPVQEPRIPIWVAGSWPIKAPFRRAARWDGVAPIGQNHELDQMMSVDQMKEITAYIEQHRKSDEPFDVVHGGFTAGKDRDQDAEIVALYATAG